MTRDVVDVFSRRGRGRWPFSSAAAAVVLAVAAVTCCPAVSAVPSSSSSSSSSSVAAAAIVRGHRVGRSIIRMPTVECQCPPGYVNFDGQCRPLFHDWDDQEVQEAHAKVLLETAKAAIHTAVRQAVQNAVHNAVIQHAVQSAVHGAGGGGASNVYGAAQFSERKFYFRSDCIYYYYYR